MSGDCFIVRNDIKLSPAQRNGANPIVVVTTLNNEKENLLWTENF